MGKLEIAEVDSELAGVENEFYELCNEIQTCKSNIDDLLSRHLEFIPDIPETPLEKLTGNGRLYNLKQRIYEIRKLMETNNRLLKEISFHLYRNQIKDEIIKK